MRNGLGTAAPHPARLGLGQTLHRHLWQRADPRSCVNRMYRRGRHYRNPRGPQWYLSHDSRVRHEGMRDGGLREDPRGPGRTTALGGRLLVVCRFVSTLESSMSAAV